MNTLVVTTALLCIVKEKNKQTKHSIFVDVVVVVVVVFVNCLIATQIT